MNWQQYAVGVLLFNMLGLVVVYALQRTQHVLPLNPQDLAAVTPDSSFNTAVSFATQHELAGLRRRNDDELSDADAGADGAEFCLGRGGHGGAGGADSRVSRVARRSTIGNFWVDLTRSTLYILLPLSLVLALVLVTQGVVQNFSPYRTVALVRAGRRCRGQADHGTDVAVGPAASQIAIKQLGTNGGGFFNVNSAHPLENPTPLSNFLEMLAILLIPAALCYTFGEMVGDRRQGWALLAAMLVHLRAAVGRVLCVRAGRQSATRGCWESIKRPATSAGGNMEGKEVRFGIANSALWATATTAASNGSVNSMHDSFTPLGGLVPMWLMQLGEVIFGGVGSGLYGMLIFAIIAVFVAGLMVGRTPEYLGKKIEAFEMKMASIVILIPPLVVLVGTAVAVIGPGLEFTAPDTGEVKGTLNNPGAHGFSEVLYAFSSAGNNNGSAFAGLSANVPFYNTALGLAMLLARYWLAIPILAIAGSLAERRSCRRAGHVADAHAAVRGAVGERRDDRRRADVHSGAGAGADRRTLADGCPV